MDTPLTPARALTATRPEAVPTGVPCRACEYELGGLFSDGNCPECGLPIQASIHGDTLALAAPAWLARVESGAWIIVWTTLSWLGLVIAGRVGITLFTQGAASPTAELVLKVALAGLSVWFLLGVWRLTTPEHDLKPSGRRLLHLVRILMISGVTLNVVQRFGTLSRAAPVPGGMLAYEWLDEFLATAAWACVMFHVTALARRAGAYKMSNSAWLTGWFIAASLGVMILAMCIGLLVSVSVVPGAPGGLLMGILGCWGAIVIPVTLLCALVLVGQFAHRLELVRHRATLIRSHQRFQPAPPPDASAQT
ncbi:MAG: hypothetical protein DYG94_06145 [Leptolyngbya sp. PLA3]|nr:MAG: hypothetical protein EDM82_03425 [Cyanobacteria bacterium CYA]MCE7968310.1 hypothetical protein [Leptolyngbya sp. PL-A3]